MRSSFIEWREYYRDLYPRYGRLPSIYYSWFNYRCFNNKNLAFFYSHIILMMNLTVPIEEKLNGSKTLGMNSVILCIL